MRKFVPKTIAAMVVALASGMPATVSFAAPQSVAAAQPVGAPAARRSAQARTDAPADAPQARVEVAMLDESVRQVRVAEAHHVGRHRRHLARAHRAPARALQFSEKAEGSLHTMIAREASSNGVPVALADAVVRIESRYNPHATNGGAMGLMQIKAQTARGMGFSGAASALLQPETNLRYGMKYLGEAYRLSHGDTCQTVMRYQSGHYAAHMSGANRAYCSKAKAIMASR